MLNLTDDLDELQASVMRALASRTRLRFVHALATGPAEVRDLAEALDISQVSASQHLAALRSVGVVEVVRDGRTAEYRLSDPDLAMACELFRTVLLRRLARLGDLAAKAEETDRYARLAAAGAAGK